MSGVDPFKSGFLPLPYLDSDRFDAENWAEIRRLQAARRIVYVRKLGENKYEIVDGGAAQA
ncbi:hypothetical protein [Bradyrhizobium betae]|uniref:Uncharacterized protein n=1 Tax=Bradyrhizobium betae TaxID=244734 RepID=A0A5P6P939_9BRAD|nr:hypothetical protein [Bradyrhizobium betae]MCS3727298.1 hypothetical protein [Bradyrhizobium betae]QFI74801.1 hypothetical protein F8237_21760 [Bradyrhizobium betae]